MISFEEFKKKIEQMGYYAEEELLYDSYDALYLLNEERISAGQDIYALCLEGPPGAGKTEYAKTYTKLANDVFGNVELVEYQCDKTTGKTELVEDINVFAVVTRDGKKINIPGKLIEAIQLVNQGKKVVLFIDEYDKAREETDSFFLKYLQSGEINSNQHGDLKIKDGCKGNLQVILCKNDMREEVSGPLSRRLRITRLEYMKPEVFYKVAKRNLIDEAINPIDSGLLNLVLLMYQKAYNDVDMYNRLPSCSEMLIALEDSDRRMKTANAPLHIIYKTIIKNMFKSLDDIETFESSLTRSNDENDKGLKQMIDEMKQSENKTENIDINGLIAEKVFAHESQELVDKTKEMRSLINTYKEKFEKMEKDRQERIEEEINQIKLENGKLISISKPSAINNFKDESVNIKRGYNIFDISDNDWTQIATIKAEGLSHSFFIEKLVEFASELGITLYENGILIKEDENFKIVAICEMKDNIPTFKVLSNLPIISKEELTEISKFIKLIYETLNEQKVLISKTDDNKVGTFKVDALIYSENDILSDKVDENVYHIEKEDEIKELGLEPLNGIINTIIINDNDAFIKKSKEMINGKGKVLV